MLFRMYETADRKVIGLFISIFILQQALDPINKPTFWPHDAEEQQENKAGHSAH